MAEPKFGDIYEWKSGGQRVMVISAEPMSFVEFPSTYGARVVTIKVFESMNFKVPFTAEGWTRVTHACDFNSGPGSDQCGECGAYPPEPPWISAP